MSTQNAIYLIMLFLFLSFPTARILMSLLVAAHVY